MSLNARVGLLAIVALVLSPVWLPLTPFCWWWLRRQRAQGRAAGLRWLLPFQAEALGAFAEATMLEAPGGGYAVVAKNADRYLAAVHSPRHWRTAMMLTLLEFGPCLLGRRRLSRLPLAARRRWIETRYSTTRGLFAVPSLARQLVRMGYYADQGVARRLGFRGMRERTTPARAAG